MAPNYPKPDRSDFTPNFVKTAENDALDIGWAEGVLSDGRPYRFECWCQDQVTNVTIFISIRGLGELDRDAVADLLEREGLLHFSSSQRYASAAPVEDPSGNELYAINVVVGDDEQTFTTGGPALTPYPKGGF